MDVEIIPTRIFKIVLRDAEQNQLGRASLVVIYNESNVRPYGLLEDVFVRERTRGQGIGRKLIDAIVQMAQRENCYKLIATSRYSRPKVHELYSKLGFADHGREFRMDFP